MSATQETPSYINITAATASGTAAIAYAEISRAAAQRDKMTYLKLMWLTSAAAAAMSHRLEVLEDLRQQLKLQLDSLTLAIAELKNVSVKDLSEAQQHQRSADCAEMDEAVRKLKTAVNNLNREIIYLDDLNEDRQTRFRSQMSGCHQKLEAVLEEKLEIIIAYLQQQNIALDTASQAALKAALNSPELQEAYLKSVSQTSNKSLTEKLKGWFTA